jgi:hypothetical protein
MYITEFYRYKCPIISGGTDRGDRHTMLTQGWSRSLRRHLGINHPMPRAGSARAGDALFHMIATMCRYG